MQRNIKILRRAFEVWNAGGVAAAIPFFDSDAKLELAPAILDEGVIYGRDAIEAYLRSIEEQLWDSFAIKGTNYEDVGARHVVVDVHMSGEGRDSHVPVEQRFVEAFELRDGSIVWEGVYTDRASALEAVGRREQAA